MKQIILCSVLAGMAGQLLALEAAAQSPVEKFLPSDPGPYDSFGTAVDLCGDLAIVGDQHDDTLGFADGSAYIFRKTPGGWEEEAKFYYALTGTGVGFGSAVAICGEHAAVGAPLDSTYGGYNGACVVYRHGPSGWSETDRLYPLGFPYQDDFGTSVALRGTTLAVGAPRDEPNGLGAGGVWVYEFTDPGGWVLDTKLFDPNGIGDDRFGCAVALDATCTRLAVGAYGDDAMGDRAGAVHVFERQAGQWVHIAELLAPDGEASDHFGSSVGLAGDTLFAGAPYRLDGGTWRGIGHVFEYSGGSWNWAASMGIPAGSVAGRFGQCCAVSEDRVVVGLGSDSWIEGGCGSALIYRRYPGGWGFETRLLAPDADWNDQFGQAVAIQENTVLVTAWYDDEGAVDAGAAYEFRIEEFAAPYCFCETGGPCGNDFGAAGCAGSLGWGGQLLVGGSGSVGSDDLVLTLQGLPRNQFGLLYMGTATTEQPFGDGMRCVAGGGIGVFRYPVLSTGPAGLISNGPGLVAFARAHFSASGHLAAGETWNFQGWYREPVGPCASGFNLSNAVAVTFSP